MLKKLLVITSILSITSAFATELKILSWYKLDRGNIRDTAAEVCFSLKPAPTEPVFANIVVDKGTSSQGNYTTWISPKGSVCHVVSTARGQVWVEVPSLEIKAKDASLDSSN